MRGRFQSVFRGFTHSVFRTPHSAFSAGFTLLEMLVVICIIGILSAALTVSVSSGYKQSRQAHCKSNLRQLGLACTIYRGEHDNELPNWISNLFPDYVDDRSLYICHADKNSGRDTPRPERLVQVRFRNYKNDTDKPTFWDNDKNNSNTRNDSIKCCSYLYEFSDAPTTWWVDGPNAPPRPTGSFNMKTYKMAQMKYGDTSNLLNGEVMPYASSHIPIIRCYHHWEDMSIYGYDDSAAKKSRRASRQAITINVAYAGNVFVGPTWWEGTIRPGENVK